MFKIFNKKKYLKRSEFINFGDSDKIWSKKMTITDINNLLIYLEKQINMYDFEFDKNFIMNSRRKGLKSMIDERIVNSNGNANDNILESLFNFWEFINDEYFGDYISISKELGISVQDLTKMDDEYRKKGIICSQEKEMIIYIIRKLKDYISNINELI